MWSRSTVHLGWCRDEESSGDGVRLMRVVTTLPIYEFELRQAVQQTRAAESLPPTEKADTILLQQWFERWRYLTAAFRGAILRQ